MTDRLRQLIEELKGHMAALSTAGWLVIGLGIGLVVALAALLALTGQSDRGNGPGAGSNASQLAQSSGQPDERDSHVHGDDHGHGHGDEGHDDGHGAGDAHGHDHDAHSDHTDTHASEDATAHAGHGHGHGHDHEDEFERGPNGGRLLRDEDGPLSLEITIFEAGRPPQFRIYPYLNDEALTPDAVKLSIDLGRLGGKTDRFAFKPENDYLAGDGAVVEPHSFDVRVKASHAGRDYAWSFASYEGRTWIAAGAAREAGVSTSHVGPAVLRETIDALGRIKFAPGAKVTLRARFPGPVLEVLKTVGDPVKRGEPLIRVESNESMQAYEIASPIDGVVLERLTNPGDLADSGPLMVIGDLSRLHVDFHIFASDQGRIRAGQEVEISAVNGTMKATTTIRAILPTREAATQTVIARAKLDNPNGIWMPGTTAKGLIVVAKSEVPLAVRTKALQRFRDFTVVFAKFGETYEVRMLELGRRTPEWSEVLGGVAGGQEYVVDNSFLIKADIEKSGAAHDH